MGIFDRNASAGLTTAFNRSRGRVKSTLSRLSRTVRRALAVAAASAVIAVSGFTNLRGAALLHSFAPEPDASALSSAHMVRIRDDNRRSAAPVVATRFLDPAYVPVVLSAVPANDDAAPALTREFKAEASAASAPSRFKGGKLKLKTDLRISGADIAAVATGLTRNSTLSTAQSAFKRGLLRQQQEGDIAPAPAPSRAVKVQETLPLKGRFASGTEKARPASNPKYDDIMAAFKRELQVAVAQQEVQPQPQKSAAPLPGPVRHIYNMSSAGVPSAVQKMRPSAAPKAPGLSVAA